ncbi:uncharacterized protein LOC144432398 [Styela clava]
MAANNSNIIVDEGMYEARIDSLLRFGNLMQQPPFMAAPFAKSGFSGVENDIMQCVGCGRRHKISQVLQNDSTDVQWHELLCPFRKAKKPCWYCSSTFFNWETFQCPKCDITSNFDKAFSEASCVICGTIVNLAIEYYERCAECSGVICRECIARRRPHVHADDERKAF